ncbi:MAG: histidine--tRNA ligase [Candidatus Paceibacterota bacterium]
MADNTKLNTEPYKGVRDFYPKDMYIQRYIFDTMSRVVEGFGYTEYGASILEPTELYQSKTSNEIVHEQTYTFTDRGDRSVTLRPEMTPTLARMIAGKRNDLVLPLRWYSIPNVFRYERPQRGRVREHWQLNADIFGVASIDAEVEIISLASTLMKTFGAKEEDFEIRISDRRVLTTLFEEFAISKEVQAQTMRLLDKREKIEDFDAQLTELLGEHAEAFTERLSRTSSSTDLESVCAQLKTLGVTNVIIDTSIVRGFDYYTGVVFEVFDTSEENNRSLFGGGRYDNLLELFGGESIPAVGFGMGDVTIADFLGTHNLLPEYSARTELYLCTLTQEAKAYAQALALKLREQDINAEVSLSDKKVGDQIKIADKKQIPFVICIGEDEMKNDTVTIKHLESGESETLKEDALVDYIFSKV